MPTEVVRKFGASYPHYPSFIVAQEWRDWANQTTAKFHGLEASAITGRQPFPIAPEIKRVQVVSTVRFYRIWTRFAVGVLVFGVSWMFPFRPFVFHK